VDLEGQLETRQVFVTQRKRELEFTAALYNPKVLSNAKTFVKDNARFEIGSADTAFDREALLIGLELNWKGLLSWIATNVILCVGVGVVVGIVTEDVNLGVAITSAVATILACLQTVLFFLSKHIYKSLNN
jgi:hypothetical protein